MPVVGRLFRALVCAMSFANCSTCRLQIAHAGSRTRVKPWGACMIPLHYVRCHLLFCFLCLLVLLLLLLLFLCFALFLFGVLLVVVVAVFVVCVAILGLYGPLCRLIVVLAAPSGHTLHPPWGSNPRPHGYGLCALPAELGGLFAPLRFPLRISQLMLGLVLAGAGAGC